jgi:hypothetical protein
MAVLVRPLVMFLPITLTPARAAHTRPVEQSGVGPLLAGVSAALTSAATATRSVATTVVTAREHACCLGYLGCLGYLVGN